MPRVSLKEHERKLLFDLVCNNLVHLGDCLSDLETKRDEDTDEFDQAAAAIVRQSIQRADALANKLSRASLGSEGGESL